MKNLFKGLLSVVVSLAMVITVMPTVEVSAASATVLPTADANGVIKLTEDVDLAAPFTIANGTTLTIDLNGYTITGVDNTSANYGLINNEGTLIVKDSRTGGKITLSATTNRGWGSYSAVIANIQGTLTIDGGTIEHTGGTDMAYGIDNLTNGGLGDAKTTVNAGTITSTYRAIRQFANSETCINELIINGGIITGNNKGVWLQSSNVKANKAVLDINKDNNPTISSVYVFAPEKGSVKEISLSINPEVVDVNNITVYLGGYANTIAPSVNGDLTITEADVIQIGDNKYTYAQLNDAIAEINNVKNAKLLTHLELTDSIIITGDTELDLNGYEIYNSTDVGVYPLIRIQNNANVTIKNGSVYNDLDYAIVLGSSDKTTSGNLTIESGSYYGDTTIVSVTKGLLTINGGEFSAKAAPAEYFGDYRYSINCFDEFYTSGDAKVVITGGKFKNFNPANNLAEGTNTNFVSENYTVIQDGVYYMVEEDSEDMITTESDLVAAINNGGKVVLNSDIYLSETLLITKKVELDLNGFEIKNNGEFNPLIRIKDGANVTVGGNGKVTNTLGYAFILGALDKSSLGNLTVNNGTYYGSTSVISVTKGTLTIVDGDFSAEPYNGDYRYTLNGIDESFGDGSAKIVVEGGKFYGYDPNNSISENPVAHFVPEGYVSKLTGETYVVSKVDAAKETATTELESAKTNGSDLTVTLGTTESNTANQLELDSDVISSILTAVDTEIAQSSEPQVVFVVENIEDKYEAVLEKEQVIVLEQIGGNTEIEAVIKAEIHVCDEEVTNFNGGTATIKYFVGKDKDVKFGAFHLAADGTKTAVNGVTYDPTTGYVSIPCPHFSVYVLTATTVVEPAKSTVEFIVDGKVWRTYRVTKGADIRMPEVPEKEGYTGEWDHDGENIRTATTITAVYTKVEEPVNNTDLSDYADFQLPVYANSRVTNIATANGSITVDGYMFKANANLDNENSIWREIIFVNEEDYSMAKAYRKQVTPVYNTWLNKNMTATGNGTYKLDYANYTVNFSNTDINNYVGNTAATRMATGSYLAYMRISDGTDSYLFPLKDIVLSDGSTLALPSGFEVVDTTTRALRYIVK